MLVCGLCFVVGFLRATSVFLLCPCLPVSRALDGRALVIRCARVIVLTVSSDALLAGALLGPKKGAFLLFALLLPRARRRSDDDIILMTSLNVLRAWRCARSYMAGWHLQLRV